MAGYEGRIERLRGMHTLEWISYNPYSRKRTAVFFGEPRGHTGYHNNMKYAKERMSLVSLRNFIIAVLCKLSSIGRRCYVKTGLLTSYGDHRTPKEQRPGSST